MDDDGRDREQLGSAPTTPAPAQTPREGALAAGSTLDMPAADQVAAGSELGPGAAIGHFRVQKKLGAGGMGAVYACVDADLGRSVAVKVVKEGTQIPAYRDRLLREAQAMARLEHPNVVRVYEVGSDRDRLFVAMELVEGTTLTAWLAGRRDWRAVLAMFEQVGAGLAAVHGAGLVHRDFKPDNVLVDRAGRARVADFGLARIEQSAPLTRSGVMMGTPGYMAPEQQFGSDVDARADQYSFCVALREALGGRPVDPARWDALPAGVRAVVTRGLSYDASERFGSIEDLVAALREAAAAGAPQPRWPLALGALAVLGIVAGVVAFASSRRGEHAAPVSAHDLAPVALITPDAMPSIAPADAAVAAISISIDAAPAHVATVHRAAADAGVAQVAAAPPGLHVDSPTTKHLPAAKPGDPGHLPVVRSAIKDLGYEGFDVDHPPATLQTDADNGDAIAQVELGQVKRRAGDCAAAGPLWDAALKKLHWNEPADEARATATAWENRALCSLAAGRADDAMTQVQRSWVHGNQDEARLLMAYIQYEQAVAANDPHGKDLAYGLLLTAEQLSNPRVQASLKIWLGGLGLGLHQDAAMHPARP